LQNTDKHHSIQGKNLRYGWTTGACATAATKAACHVLLTEKTLSFVDIVLPKGQIARFDILHVEKGMKSRWAACTVKKDAGDDPDVTHEALITSKVWRQSHNDRHSRVHRKIGGILLAGQGVGIVTKLGLAISPGEPAINPVPRAMLFNVIRGLLSNHAIPACIIAEISIANGEKLAQKTWNQRLGIYGGLSILGTTGIVRPFSCSAWIASIHRGIDIARATGVNHVCGSTGNTSEALARNLYQFPDAALLDMGDFVGGMLRYLCKHPIPRLTICGGFGKTIKLSQGCMDLHSGRSQIDFSKLAEVARELQYPPETQQAILTSQTAMAVLTQLEILDVNLEKSPLIRTIAEHAHRTVKNALKNNNIAVEIIISDRKGRILNRTNFET
jgi:cobalt-precorrin-5B (C1)-methyltransferase